MEIAKNILSRLLPMSALCLAISACTSDREADEPVRSDGSVRFSAMLSNAGADNGVEIGTRADEGDSQSDYLNLRFNEGDRIRVAYTTVENQTPDFETDGKYYEYERDEEKSNDGKWYYKYAFTPYENNGFRWSDLPVYGNSYVLEAAFYPCAYDPDFFVAKDSKGDNIKDDEGNNKNTVPVDQHGTDNNGHKILKKTDLMLAHHRKHVSEYGNEIELKFRHVFSMINVSLTVPIYDQTTYTGFPEPESDTDIPKGCLTNLRTEFAANYHASVSSDDIIQVSATGDAVNEIVMCPASYNVDSETEKTITYHYLVIIPKQQIDASGEKPLLRFYMKDAADKNVTYRFTPNNTSIMLEQGYVTQINLILPRKSTNPILVSATLAPWTQAYSDMILEEKNN